MDFWIDMGLAVLFRLLKDQKKAALFFRALWKLHDAIEDTFPSEVRERMLIENSTNK